MSSELARQHRGVRMREGLAMAGLGVGLFASAMVGTLAIQGRLNSDGFSSLPVVSWFTTQEGAIVEEPDELGGDRVAARSPAAQERRAEPEVDGLFAFPKLDSGMTTADLERIFQQANAAREAADQERAVVAAELGALEIRQQDIEDRESAIAQKMIEVDRERDRLDQRIEEFERQVLLVERDEIRALRDYGRSLAAFAPERAAAIVMQEWATDAGRKRIARVLTLMDPADADAMVAALPDDRLREVLLERMKVVVEPRDR